ncbi:hypothetical protein FPOAC2_03684 [Fusarium poae]|uniref:hypothetical protein n=1 Tax=Fusarium poae TaxID=36050 RepID=UPI001CE9AE24|nr:hypothetical protein FPOAC1_003574 [Fusarium poae]KAG8677551.1 hypothetical protein FPOAC1_003574 [Fusarium poae]
MHSSTIIFFATLLTGVVAPPPEHFLNFVCTGEDSDDMPDVCNNMCYGATCKKLPTQLYWDQPEKPTRQRRSRNAGCGTTNKCDDGEQCDEYPFASTSNADDVKAVSRCVPTEQNRNQGQVLKQFYNSQGSFDEVGLGGNKGHFTIGFGNPGDSPYCSPNTDCVNDGHEYTRDGLARRSHIIKRRDKSFGYYKLKSGGTFFAPSGAKPGDLVFTPRFHNRTLGRELSRKHVFDPERGLEQYEYMMGNMYTDRDEVVGPAED